MDSLKTNISDLSDNDFKLVKQFIKTEQTKRTRAKSERTRQLNIEKNRNKQTKRDLEDITDQLGETEGLMKQKVRRSARPKTKANIHNVAQEPKKTKKKKRSPPKSNNSIDELFKKMNLGSSSSPQRKRTKKKKSSSKKLSLTKLIPGWDDDL